MDIEKQIYSEKELEKIEELRRKNEVEKINKINSIEREKEHKEWRENCSNPPKVLNIGIQIREEFKKMTTRELLSYYRGTRFSYGWDWDNRDEWNHHMVILELQTELSQREHVPRKDERKSKIDRQRLAKKNKGNRRGHKKK